MGPFELLQKVKKKTDTKKGNEQNNDNVNLVKGTLIVGGALLFIKLMFMICGVESNNTEGELTRRSRFKLHDGL